MSSMPTPSPYAQRSAPSESKEDCRDYLRTGRCKYGASCKYNHPPNVQNGGGMKAPIDPSEPMFPVRPSEPVCQYYMKHGTCKFGQTCKFHHPPQTSPPSSSATSNNVAMGAVRRNDGPQLLWNASGQDSNVQLLPQRPDEPNCIFFLKNGRCKYGSACRYHHPLNYHDRRTSGDDGRRQYIQVQQVPNDSSMPKIHYLTSLPHGSHQGHFVVADGTVTFVSIDGSAPTQVISVPQGNKDGQHVVYTTSGNRSLGMSREVASSSSSTSIASSYETANSNMEQHGDSSSSLWNRPRRSASANNLNTFSIPENRSGQHVAQGGARMMQNGNDPNSNLPKVISSGSTGDAGHMYYDNNAALLRQYQPHPPANPGDVWRGRRSNSFDHTGMSSSGFHNQEDEYHERSRDGDYQQGYLRDQQRSPMGMGRPPPGSRSNRRPQTNNQVDDGLSMMTSALLTMLDTPEEAAAVAAQYGGYLPYEEQRGVSPQQMQPPQMRQHQMLSSPKGPSGTPDSPGDARQYPSGASYMQPPPSYFDSNMEGRVLHRIPGQSNTIEQPNREGNQVKSRAQSDDEQSGWSLDWQGSSAIGRPLHENSQSMPMMRSDNSSNAPHSSSNVGLYLP